MKIAIVGEAWGEHEAAVRQPFVGPAGQEMTRMLFEAGINRGDCFITNVFNLHPDRNDIGTLCSTKAEMPKGYDWPMLAPGKYLRPEFFPEVYRLKDELMQVHPNIIVAFGNTASWALLRQTAISKIRGVVTSSTLVPGVKVLPTFHPAAIMRQWELRHVTILDLIKARKESVFPDIRRVIRRIILEPSLGDISDFAAHLCTGVGFLTFDIETYADQITCIGFSPSKELALVVPFVDYRKPNRSYWDTLEEELKAWDLVHHILGSDIPKIAQNGLYDIQYLWIKYGIPVKNFAEDTMLLHHALQPESPKSLGFLGSVYANEAAWKLIQPRGKHTEKRDE